MENNWLWLSGCKLMQRWNLNDVEIIKYVIKGLQPYDNALQPMLPPYAADWYCIIRELHEDIEDIEKQFPAIKNSNYSEWCSLNHDRAVDENNNLEKIEFPDGSDSEIRGEYEEKKAQLEKLEIKLNKYYALPSWVGYELPPRKTDRMAVIDQLLNALYKWEDILEIEKGPRNKDGSKNKAISNPIILQQDDTDNVFENYFIREGNSSDQIWRICFKGKELSPITNSDGLIYISNLLQKPGQHIHVTDLCNSINPSTKKAMIGEDDLTDSLNKGSMNISNMQDDELDEKGKQDLKNKLCELEETIDDTSLTATERRNARIERDKIMETLTTVYGKNSLRHRAPRKVNENVKRDMDRARKAIIRTYVKIKEQSPDLAEYLSANIITGSQFIFIGTDISWHISF